MTDKDPHPDRRSPWVTLAGGLLLLGLIPVVLVTNDRLGAFGFVEVVLLPGVVGGWMVWVALVGLLRARR